MSHSKLSEWDADALEKAARNMRELDKSVNARSAFELAKREQDVQIAVQGAKSKEHEAAKVQAQAQLEHVRWEEQRKTIEAKAQAEKQLVDYKAQKQRETVHEEHNLLRKRDEENRSKALEDERMKAAIRAKAERDMLEERRRAEEHRAEIERRNMQARALAEAEGRIKEQRENEHIFTKQLQLKFEEERKTKLEAIDAYMRNFRDGFRSFVSNPSQMAAVIGGLTILAGGVYGMREAARVTGRFIEKRLGTPSLVRETSRSMGQFSLRNRFSRAVGLAAPAEGAGGLDEVILRANVADRVKQLAISVRNTRANAAPYRHLLFFGPPGTGKTMLAKRLARTSGMDYAIMSGGDVGPLGREAVTELHKLFDWAQTSKRGLLLFIDEADAFLGSRSRQQMSEDQRNALNALLYRTGEASKKFMLVLATNRPDRVDEAMVFESPDRTARGALVKQYYAKYILHAGDEARYGPFNLLRNKSAAILPQGISDTYLESIAERTEGFSGREISKLFISMQGSVYGRAQPVLTEAIAEEVVQWKIQEHAQKQAFATTAYDFVNGSAPSFAKTLADRDAKLR